MNLSQDLGQKTQLSSYELLCQCLDPLMQSVVRLLDKCAKGKRILITGESGTGKELVAKALHERGELAAGPFITVDCSQLSGEVMKSELFGHEVGSFTGATKQKIGSFESANGGTLFLDEVGTIPLELQTRLLRVTQGQPFSRVGGNIPVKSDFQLVVATNSDLSAMVKKSQFREDLYYRLEAFSIEVPPLRERYVDVIRLAQHFLTEFGAQEKTFDSKVLVHFQSHSWPGNVRELRNCIERGVVFSNGNRVIVEEDLQLKRSSSDSVEYKIGSLVSLKKIEELHIKSVLEKVKNLGDASGILGIDQATLYRKRKKWGME